MRTFDSTSHPVPPPRRRGLSWFLIVLAILAAVPSAHGNPAEFGRRIGPTYLPAKYETVWKLFQAQDCEALSKEVDAIVAKTKRLIAPEKLYVLKAVCEHALSLPQKALESLRKAASFSAASADVNVLLGMTYLSLNDPQKAINAFKDALWFERPGLYPVDEIHILLYRLYKTLELEAEATSALQQASAKNPQSFSARQEQALNMMASGNRAEAIRLSREAAFLAPQNADLKLLLAQALLTNVNRSLHRKDIDESVNICAGVLKQEGLSDSQYAAALPVYVRALLAKGDRERAAEVVAASKKRISDTTLLASLERQIQIEGLAAGATPAPPLSPAPS